MAERPFFQVRAMQRPIVQFSFHGSGRSHFVLSPPAPRISVPRRGSFDCLPSSPLPTTLLPAVERRWSRSWWPPALPLLPFNTLTPCRCLQRYRICETHMLADQVLFQGMVQRFCQQVRWGVYGWLH